MWNKCREGRGVIEMTISHIDGARMASINNGEDEDGDNNGSNDDYSRNVGNWYDR